MTTIHVVGLGPGDLSGLPMGTFDLLQSGLPIFLRTRIHPAVDDLVERGIVFESFDSSYDTSDTFEEVYMSMARTLVTRANSHGDIIYAVPGHPLIAEQSVQNLYGLVDDGIEIVIGPGQSFLDAICTLLRFDPIDGLQLLDGMALSDQQVDLNLHTLIAQVFDQSVASEVKLALMNLYPDDFKVKVIRAAGVPSLERVEEVSLFELDRIPWLDHLTTIYVPPTVNPTVLERDPWYVTRLVAALRAPDGCPWDKSQTHETLRPYVIEEAYEVANAIDGGDSLDLADELGDLYLQILLHAQIGQEYGDFSVRDVYSSLTRKLLRRHPHVFGDCKAETVEAAEQSWHTAKAQEKSSAGTSTLLGGVKQGLPPLYRAYEVQKRAAMVGFDWETSLDVLEKVKEEMNELEIEILAGRDARVADELGDLWFSSINLARWMELDVETVLASAVRKFEERFSKVEEFVQESGAKWTDFSIEQLNLFWNDAKNKQNHKN